MAFALYQFACIMLHSFKPGPRFAIRNVGNLSSKDVSTVPQREFCTDIGLSVKYKNTHARYVVLVEALPTRFSF